MNDKSWDGDLQVCVGISVFIGFLLLLLLIVLLKMLCEDYKFNREAKNRNRKNNQAWRDCRKQFTFKVGSIFEDSKIPCSKSRLKSSQIEKIKHAKNGRV
jgi:hypothetical protein